VFVPDGSKIVNITAHPLQLHSYFDTADKQWTKNRSY